jgi:hypothetical protein
MENELMKDLQNWGKQGKSKRKVKAIFSLIWYFKLKILGALFYYVAPLICLYFALMHLFNCLIFKN